MDCHEFDGQVVRLESIKAEAEQFVRVRLPRIDLSDLSLFEFDHDLTFMVFFLNADQKVYARYGGRDARSADGRQSLAGLRYTMRAVLQAHQDPAPHFAPRDDTKPRYLRDTAAVGGRCLHCHQVKEVLHRQLVAQGEWSRERVYRYPLPDNLGLRLEVDRGNVVARVDSGSAAERAGLKPGDVLQTLGDAPVLSLADAQFALDRAPGRGGLPVSWVRQGTPHDGTLTLADGWRKGDITWRPSLRRLVPSLPLYGDDLDAAERKKLGLTDRQLAFRQKTQVSARGKEAGFQGGDVILGIDGRPLDMTMEDFLDVVRREYLVGDTLALNVLRDGKALKVSITLTAR